MVAYVAYILEAGAELSRPVPREERLIDGNDVMRELGLEAGPELGSIMHAVEEAIGAGEVTTREEAIALAREVWEAQCNE
jgi:hypothetical protein